MVKSQTFKAVETIFDVLLVTNYLENILKRLINIRNIHKDTKCSSTLRQIVWQGAQSSQWTVDVHGRVNLRYRELNNCECTIYQHVWDRYFIPVSLITPCTWCSYQFMIWQITCFQSAGIYCNDYIGQCTWWAPAAYTDSLQDHLTHNQLNFFIKLWLLRKVWYMTRKSEQLLLKKINVGY